MPKVTVTTSQVAISTLVKNTWGFRNMKIQNNAIQEIWISRWEDATQGFYIEATQIFDFSSHKTLNLEEWYIKADAVTNSNVSIVLY